MTERGSGIDHGLDRLQDSREKIFTPQDMKEIYRLFLEIHANIPEKLKGLEAYSGTDQGIGEGNSYHNSVATLHQLEYALAMTRHPLVREMASEHFDPVKFNPRELVENKVMAGLKILDLGCGHTPVFARVSRSMGADVWTVDKIAADGFHCSDSFRSEARKSEIEKHIQMQLSHVNAKISAGLIRQKSGGEFNLVTASNLDSDGFAGGKDIAMLLLKKGGIYNGGSPRIFPEQKK